METTDVCQQNETILSCALEILVRTLDVVSGNDIADGFVGESTVLTTRAELGMVAIRRHLHATALMGKGGAA